MPFVTGIVEDGPVLQCVKDPDAILDYGLDWTKWLDGDTITSSSWLVPAGITVQTSSIDPTNKATTAWLVGGVDGSEYDIVNRIITALGRVDDRTIRLVVRER